MSPDPISTRAESLQHSIVSVCGWSGAGSCSGLLRKRPAALALRNTCPSKETLAELSGARLGISGQASLLAPCCSLKSVCADGQRRKMALAFSFILREGNLSPLLSKKLSQKSE